MLKKLKRQFDHFPATCF